jgi:hypothetical protein
MALRKRARYGQAEAVTVMLVAAASLALPVE